MIGVYEAAMLNPHNQPQPNTSIKNGKQIHRLPHNEANNKPTSENRRGIFDLHR